MADADRRGRARPARGHRCSHQDPPPGKVDAGRTVDADRVGRARAGRRAQRRNLDQVDRPPPQLLGGRPRGEARPQEASDTVPGGQGDPHRSRRPARPCRKGTAVTIVVSQRRRRRSPVPGVVGLTEAAGPQRRCRAAGFLQRVVYQDVPFGSTQRRQGDQPDARRRARQLPKGETRDADRRQGRRPPPTTTTPPPTTDASADHHDLTAAATATSTAS